MREKTMYKCSGCDCDIERINTPNPDRPILCRNCRSRRDSYNYYHNNKEEIKEFLKVRTSFLRNNSICNCGKPCIEGKKYCIKCKDNQANRIARFKESGLCTICGKVPPVEGKLRCTSCAEKQRLATIKSREKKKNA